VSHPDLCAQCGGMVLSGLRHNQASTLAMQAMARPAAQILDTVNSRNTALADMTLVAPHLALRLTTPPWRQSRSILPNRRCCSSHANMRGELRAAAQAASRTNGVVGSTGRKMPRKPSARLTTAKARNIHCSPRGNGFEAVDAGGRLGWEDMPRIVPGEQKGRA
jgi:hypothetical protein